MRRWKTNEVRYLQENYGFVPVEEIAEYLDRSAESVRQYASRKMGLRSARPHRLYQDVDEIKFLIYEGFHPTEIAEKLGTSTKAIYNRVKYGKQYDKFDYRVLLANRRRKGRIPRAKRGED